MHSQEKIKRIKTISRIITKVMTVLLGFSYLMAGLMLVMIIIRMWTAANIAEAFDSMINIRGVMGSQLPLYQAVGIIIFALITAGSVCWVLHLIRRVFKDMYRNQAPFTLEQAKRLKIIAILLFLVLVINPMFTTNFNREFSFDWFGPSAIGCIAPIAFYCLALVFEYGALLQQAEDETL